MAGSASISGLASGLDTATIINQLMQLEANPQTLLKQRVNSEKTSLTSLQTVNSKFASLATKAADLAKLENWSPVKATSSSDQVTVNATSTAVPSSLSLTVNQIATAASLSLTDKVANLTDRVTAVGSTVVRIVNDGTTFDVSTEDGTLSGLVKAINTSDAPVSASIVKTDAGYRLSLTARATGDASNFAVTNLDGSPLLSGPMASGTTGQDAVITVGSDIISSPTNTFTGLMPGVDVTISANAISTQMIGDSTTLKATTATVTVSQDTASMASSVKALVDAANSALSDITSLTAYNSSTKSGGLLAGDSTLRQLRDQVLSAVTSGVGGVSLASVGIQLDKSGNLVFDSAKFTAAYNANPATVAAKFTGETGFASKINAIADTASDSVDGSITSTIKSKNTAIDRLNKDIENWDRRLELRRTTLTRQFTALETAMSQMQAQSSWLASQISSLPQMNS